MSVSKIAIVSVLAVVIIGGVGLMRLAATPDCKVMKSSNGTTWDGSNPACRDQGSR